MLTCVQSTGEKLTPCFQGHTSAFSLVKWCASNGDLLLCLPSKGHIRNGDLIFLNHDFFQGTDISGTLKQSAFSTTSNHVFWSDSVCFWIVGCECIIFATFFACANQQHWRRTQASVPMDAHSPTWSVHAGDREQREPSKGRAVVQSKGWRIWTSWTVQCEIRRFTGYYRKIRCTQSSNK